MTTPTTQTAAQQPPPQQPAGPSDAELAAAAAVALGAAVTVPAMTALLAKIYIVGGVERLALQSALQVVMSMPPEVTGIAGPATAQVARLNMVRRGQMVLSIGRRLTSDIKQARSKNESIGRALLDGVSRETRYFGMHREAIWARERAAMAVDMEALQHGLLLGWYTHLDDRTTPDCRAADGKNFRADAMPDIGYPGTVHAKCRCRPGAPFRGARELPSTGLLSTPGTRLHSYMQQMDDFVARTMPGGGVIWGFRSS